MKIHMIVWLDVAGSTQEHGIDVEVDDGLSINAVEQIATETAMSLLRWRVERDNHAKN